MKKYILTLMIIFISSTVLGAGNTVPGLVPFSLDGATGGNINGDLTVVGDGNVEGDIIQTGQNVIAGELTSTEDTADTGGALTLNCRRLNASGAVQTSDCLRILSHTSHMITLDNNSNFGINVLAPLARLHVVGNGLVTGTFTIGDEVFTDSAACSNPNYVWKTDGSQAWSCQAESGGGGGVGNSLNTEVTWNNTAVIDGISYFKVDYANYELDFDNTADVTKEMGITFKGNSTDGQWMSGKEDTTFGTSELFLRISQWDLTTEFGAASTPTVHFEDLVADAIEYVIGNRSDAITTGIAGVLEIPWDFDIVATRVICDQSGSIVIDAWVDTFAAAEAGTLTNADSIMDAGTPMTVSTAIGDEDVTMTSWTTDLTKNYWMMFNVDSASTVTQCTISFTGWRTQ